MKTVAADMLLILSNRGGCAIELCWWARALIIVDLFGVVRSYRRWEHGYGVEKHTHLTACIDHQILENACPQAFSTHSENPPQGR